MGDEATHKSLIIIYAILLHLTWAISLFFDPAAGNATAVHTLLNFASNDFAVAIYAVVGGFAILGLFHRKGVAKPLYLLPQQFVLMVSAGGSLWAMWLGQFADGVQRSHTFLIADQSPAVIAAVLHTYAIFMIAHDDV